MRIPQIRSGYPVPFFLSGAKPYSRAVSRASQSLQLAKTAASNQPHSINRQGSVGRRSEVDPRRCTELARKLLYPREHREYFNPLPPPHIAAEYLQVDGQSTKWLTDNNSSSATCAREKRQPLCPQHPDHGGRDRGPGRRAACSRRRRSRLSSRLRRGSAHL